jgi:hypothetical protein
MTIPKKISVGLIAGFLLSAPSVQAQANLTGNGVGSVSRTRVSREGGVRIAEDGAALPLCGGADGMANRAFAGVTLSDFAPAALASLTFCEMRTLETQLGVGKETEATLVSGYADPAQQKYYPKSIR